LAWKLIKAPCFSAQLVGDKNRAQNVTSDDEVEGAESKQAYDLPMMWVLFLYGKWVAVGGSGREWVVGGGCSTAGQWLIIKAASSGQGLKMVGFIH